ncbi:Glutathione S-transferase F13 [Morella rubra]|uniref:glutathione transferase n=1 Tax=Morella rubra TaxID=262757 RepID=A0A6A1URD6_9ROSI|nr:Glutathione S-transferase F13 [Morella rubra]
MALKLYGLPISICTSRAMVCLHEKGVDFELVPVNLFGGEHKQPPFLAKNPFAKIPVLEDGDLTLFGLTAFLCATESRAITSYIAEKFKETGTDLIRHQNLNEAASVKVWLEKLEKVLDVYESKLSSTKYLAGDFFSLADLHHHAYTHFLMKTPWASLINDRPHVKAWWEDISSRPATKKVAEGMTIAEKK